MKRYPINLKRNYSISCIPYFTPERKWLTCEVMKFKPIKEIEEYPFCFFNSYDDQYWELLKNVVAASLNLERAKRQTKFPSGWVSRHKVVVEPVLKRRGYDIFGDCCNEMRAFLINFSKSELKNICAMPKFDESSLAIKATETMGIIRYVMFGSLAYHKQLVDGFMNIDPLYRDSVLSSLLKQELISTKEGSDILTAIFTGTL